MRLIDADKANAHAIPINFDYIEPSDLQDWINEQPTIDPVHVAGGCYCRECKYFDRELQYTKCVAINGLKIATECDFCSYGERREGEDNELSIQK